MDVQDLMVNDWVLVKAHHNIKEDQYCKIKTIPDIDSENNVGHHYGHVVVSVEWEEDGEKMCEPYYECESRFVEPAPITKEILLKNGFKEMNPECGMEWKVMMGDYFTRCGWGTRIIMYKFKGNGLIKTAVTVVPGELSSREGGEVVIKALYLHELQHAMRLCGLKDKANNIEVGNNIRIVP